MTLRDAAGITGIPVGTLRKWARRGVVDSRLDERADGTYRLVSLASVRERAERLGRDSGPPATTEPVPAPEASPGTMIVPIDAWNKMLLQLGNLHEAGRQLAEARERAAKAETEARFLRERLAELRARLERLEGSPSQPAAETAPRGWLGARLRRVLRRR